MNTCLDLFSIKKGEISKFLNVFFHKKFNLKNDLHFKLKFSNPIDMIDIISILIDNSDTFNITIWICLDEDILINVNKTNANNIIKYLFERYPY